MAKLAELRSLVNLAQRLGQEPSAALLEHVARLEREEQQRQQREASIKQRIAQDLEELFTVRESTHELVQENTAPPSTPEDTTTPYQSHDRETAAGSSRELTEDSATPPAAESMADRVARVISETGVVAPDPVLAQPQKDLEREIRYLREWVGKIAATGPGSGEVNFRWLDDVDRSSIAENRLLSYNPVSKKFQFYDTRVSIEAFDRSTSIAITTTPTLLRPNSTINAKNMTYDSSTGVFTFLRQCEVTLGLSINAVATASNQRVYQYAERNIGSGWVVIPNSGKNFQLINGQHTQIVNAQTISREAGEQIRYFIYSDANDKVTLITETLPNVTSGTVYVPAIRIQYAGR